MTRLQRRCSLLACVLSASLLASAALAEDAVPANAPAGLMCELLARPESTTLCDPHPEFSWIVNHEGPDQRQSAYHLLVASDAAALTEGAADLWDSGRVSSDQSTAVRYSGKPLASDRSYWWKVRTWDRNGVPGEFSAPQQFRTGKLDASARPTATRYPLVQTELPPVKIDEKGPGHYVADFGRAAFGTVKLDLTCDRDGQSLEVHLGERLDAGGCVHRKPGGTVRYRAITVPLRAGRHSYRLTIPPDKRNSSGAAILMPRDVGEVMPFRYCEILNAPSPLDPGGIRQVAVHYPFDDSAAQFRCSDAVLNDVWELCKYTMKATSFCGVYVDGDRERIPYEADAYINQLGHYCTDREFTLARYSHEYLIDHPTWPTEWIPHSVMMAWADYMHTGDADSLARFYDDLQAKTLLALRREDGLVSTAASKPDEAFLKTIHLDKPLRDIVDWPVGERDGYDLRTVNTVVNAFHYRAMVLMARIAGVLDRQEDQRRFAQQAERTARSINEKLFDVARGVYLDGEGSSHASLHANMFPLAMGLVPPSRVKSVAEFVAGKGMACSVYGAQYLLEALYNAGADEAALKLLSARGERSWGHMIYDVGSTITLEAWDDRFKPNQDWNHAWGAAPANIIPRRLMGITPLEAGFRVMEIRPQIGSLEWAHLKLPTIRGAVGVEVRSTKDAFTLETSLPANTSARVYLPCFGRAEGTVVVDGQAVRAPAEGAFLRIDNVGSGRHTFQRAKR